MPSTWLLAVRERAFEDLGVPEEMRGEIDALKRRHHMLRAFFSDFTDETRVDGGVRLQQVPNPGVFRIRAGDQRAAVWYDVIHGVVWLCRVLTISSFPDEPALYRYFGKLAMDSDLDPSKDGLLPTSAERRAAGGEQHLQAVRWALAAALRRAHSEPGAWQPATIRMPDKRILHAGRAYVDRVTVDPSGELVTRFMLILDDWPPHLDRPVDWRESIVATCFEADEPVLPAYRGLPPGSNLRPGEIPLVQERLEAIKGARRKRRRE